MGLPAHGSDLNPVAVMIGKAMIEIPPKFKDMPPIHPGIKERSFYRNAEGLAEDVKYYGEWMRQKAWERIGHLYPQVDLPKEYGGGKATVIAWIWARTVPSPDPAFADVQVPIASSFLVNSKSGKEVWVEPIVDRQTKTITNRIRQGGTKAEIAKAKDGTKAGRGANFRCLISDTAITPDHVKKCSRAGKLGQSLMTMLVQSGSKRFFLPPEPHHEALAHSAPESWAPEISLPNHSQYIGVLGYGFETFGDLFTKRQLCGLNQFADLLQEVRDKVEADSLESGAPAEEKSVLDGGNGAAAYAEAVSLYLAFAVDRIADYGSTVATWAPDGFIRSTFSRQAIQMTWDFAECNFFSDGTGNFSGAVDWVVKAMSSLPAQGFGSIRQHDAQTVEYPARTVISTDPPYYDNIPYADISDYFYAWLRRSAPRDLRKAMPTLSVPKMEELVADRMRHGSAQNAEAFFLHGMRSAMSAMVQGSQDESPATIYYAFKQSDLIEGGISSTGWATFLTAVIEAGFSVGGTWPMRTERPNRMRAVGSNALANSVVLVCRKKEASADTITRAEFIRALKRELPPAIAELQAANIAPADMPQSAIGPGMGVFSRYKAVLEADDSPMTVKTALQLINAELDEYLGGIQGEFDADTRFAITWFEQHGMGKGDYGVADNLARARGISVDSVKHAGIVESAAGKVRLLKRDELDPDWAPEEDGHLTVWECLQHLVRLHEKEGLSHDTAALLKRFGPQAEAVKDLAYCLYDIAANKRREASEATVYNALIADWSELSQMAATVSLEGRNRQMNLEV